MNCIELCAGGGGQALGLHNAGFSHAALVELDSHACNTLRFNSRRLNLEWENVLELDLGEFAETESHNYRHQVDLVAGGVPCPPFSKAGEQLGGNDERDLFPTALRIVENIDPMMVMLENVTGLNEEKFDEYRHDLSSSFTELGYRSSWKVLNASDFGVPQLRPRLIFIAIKNLYFDLFSWPEPSPNSAPTVGEVLYPIMASNGWEQVDDWAANANSIAPTIVGGSKKHGGPDLGPTRSKKQWHSLGVNGHRIGYDDEIPSKGFRGVLSRDGTIREGYENMPLLTVPMAALLQGFPPEWKFTGKKTHAYRQVGNAFPPPVAEAVGIQLRRVYNQVQMNEVELA